MARSSSGSKTPVIDSVDQQNLSGTLGVGFGDTGASRDYLAMGFTPTYSDITAVGFNIGGKSGNSQEGYAVWIDNADASFFPTGSVFTGIGGFTKIFNSDIVTNTLSRYSLASTVILTPGQRYAVVVSPYNTTSNTWTPIYQNWLSSITNPYAAGRRVHANASFTGWNAPDSGTSDLVFQTYGSGRALSGSRTTASTRGDA